MAFLDVGSPPAVGAGDADNLTLLFQLNFDRHTFRMSHRDVGVRAIEPGVVGLRVVCSVV